MTTAQFVIVITASCLAYLVLAGVTWAVVPQDWRDYDLTGLAVVFWPLALPVLFGTWLARRISTWRTALSLPRAVAKERQP